MAVYLGTEKVDIHGLVVKEVEKPDYLNYGTASLNVNFQNKECPEEVVVDYEHFKVSSMRQMFQGATGVKNIKLICREPQISGIDCYYAFVNNNIKTIDLTEFPIKFGNGGGMFQNQSVETIFGELDFTSAAQVGQMFKNAYMLKEVRIKPNTIKISLSFPDSPLSNSSLQSIVDGLVDLTDQTAQTISFYPTIKAKLTEEQIANITNKNWTLA